MKNKNILIPVYKRRYCESTFWLNGKAVAVYSASLTARVEAPRPELWGPGRPRGGIRPGAGRVAGHKRNREDHDAYVRRLEFVNALM